MRLTSLCFHRGTAAKFETKICIENPPSNLSVRRLFSREKRARMSQLGCKPIYCHREDRRSLVHDSRWWAWWWYTKHPNADEADKKRWENFPVFLHPTDGTDRLTSEGTRHSLPGYCWIARFFDAIFFCLVCLRLVSWMTYWTVINLRVIFSIN